MTYGFKVKYDAEGELWVMDLVADIQRKIKVCKVTGRRLAVEKINCLPGQRVLEVGVGIALSLSFYPGQSSVVGIDISPHMIARANQRVLQKACAIAPWASWMPRIWVLPTALSTRSPLCMSFRSYP